MQLRSKGSPIELVNELTLRDLEIKLKQNGDVKKSVEFYDSDDNRLASSTKMKYVLMRPYFKMNIDHLVQHHCFNEENVNENYTILNSNELEIYEDLRSFNVKDISALTLAKFKNAF